LEKTVLKVPGTVPSHWTPGMVDARENTLYRCTNLSSFWNRKSQE